MNYKDFEIIKFSGIGFKEKNLKNTMPPNYYEYNESFENFICEYICRIVLFARKAFGDNCYSKVREEMYCNVGQNIYDFFSNVEDEGLIITLPHNNTSIRDIDFIKFTAHDTKGFNFEINLSKIIFPYSRDNTYTCHKALRVAAINMCNYFFHRIDDCAESFVTARDVHEFFEAVGDCCGGSFYCSLDEISTFLFSDECSNKMSMFKKINIGV